jgi:hypothetical protein
MQMVKKVMSMLFLMVLILIGAIGQVNAEEAKDNIANVEGTIKEDGTSLKNSLVMIREKGKLNWIPAITDGKGSFRTKLSDGTYAVKGVKGKNTGWYSTNENFVVSEGKIKGLKDGVIVLSKKEQGKKPLEQSSNFNGVLKEGTKGLKADLIVSRYSEYEEEIYTVSSIGNGSFSASLPDGNYFLFGMEVDGGFYRYELGFTIIDGEVLVEGEPQTNLSITIPVNAYTGKVEDSAASLAEANIVLERLLSEDEYNTEFIQSVVTNKKGEFSLRALADGTYTISVYHETYSSWNEVTFEVIDGTIYIDGVNVSSLQIIVPDINLKGSVSDGNLPITDGYVNFEGETSDGKFNGYGTPVYSNGNFQYRLQDGVYTVTFIDEKNRSTSVNVPFEIRDGKLLQNGEVTSTLAIEVPPVTFSGKLLDSGNVLHGGVYIENVSEDGGYEWYYAATDENGIYSLRLKDGNYRVTGGYLFEEGEEVAFTATFDIINGQLVIDGQVQSLLELQVPPVSVHGVVKDGDQAVTNGYVSVISEHQGIYVWKSLTSDGTFTMRLADSHYTVQDVQLEDGTSAVINQSFSVADGKTYVNGQLQEVLEISVPPVTVTGTLTDAGNPMMGNFQIMEMNDADNPLQVWGSANEEGRFQLRLPDGEYKVYDVYLQDGTVFNSGIEFSIVSGQLHVNDKLEQQLNILVAPVTVSGSVHYGQEAVVDGYVGINTLADGNWNAEYHSMIDNGIYKARLEDGEYEISFVEAPQGSFQLGKKFNITDGKIFVDGQEVSALDINLQDGLQ